MKDSSHAGRQTQSYRWLIMHYVPHQIPNSEDSLLPNSNLVQQIITASPFLRPCHQDISTDVNQLDHNLTTIRAITAQYQLELRQKRQSTTPQTQQNTYQPGDYILWNPKENQNSFRSSKLSPTLLGPYTVTKQEGNKISCYHNQLHTQHIFHSDRVTPFIGSTTIANKIGLLDKEEYVVEKIKSHRGTWNKLKSIELLVRWQGYTADSDSWEPWSNMRRVHALHTYLRLINKEKFISA